MLFFCSRYIVVENARLSQSVLPHKEVNYVNSQSYRTLENSEGKKMIHAFISSKLNYLNSLLIWFSATLICQENDYYWLNTTILPGEWLLLTEHYNSARRVTTTDWTLQFCQESDYHWLNTTILPGEWQPLIEHCNTARRVTTTN